MSTQLLIYERAVPVSKKRHANLGIDGGNDFTFAKHVNAVPLTCVEFPHAAKEYAIVFSGNENGIMPYALLGIRDDENVYVTESGSWDAAYVPAFVRRYPFVFAGKPDEEKFTLCVDEEYAGLNAEGRGDRLFDQNGEATDYLNRVLEFTRDYQVQYRRTVEFCKKLRELDLIGPAQAQIRMGSEKPVSFRGIMAVNRDRLKGLSGEALSDLAKSDGLELIYTHLISMRNLSDAAKRAAKGVAKPDGADAASELVH